MDAFQRLLLEDSLEDFPGPPSVPPAADPLPGCVVEDDPAEYGVCADHE